MKYKQGGTIRQQAMALAEAGAEPAYVMYRTSYIGRSGIGASQITQQFVRWSPPIQFPVPAEKQLDGKVKVLSIAPLLSQAILRVHQHRSVSQVFRDQHLDFPV